MDQILPSQGVLNASRLFVIVLIIVHITLHNLITDACIGHILLTKKHGSYNT